MADGSCASFIRASVGHFTQYSLSERMKQKLQPSHTMRRDLFHFKFRPLKGEVLDVSRAQFGVWNATNHPTPVYAYLLPTLWEQKVIESLQSSIAAAGASVSFMVKFLKQFEKGVGFRAILSTRLPSGHKVPIEPQEATGKKTLALIATVDNGEVCLWDTYSIRQGDCLVLLPSALAGEATHTQRMPKGTNIKGMVLQMHLVGEAFGNFNSSTVDGDGSETVKPATADADGTPVQSKVDRVDSGTVTPVTPATVDVDGTAAQSTVGSVGSGTVTPVPTDVDGTAVQCTVDEVGSGTVTTPVPTDDVDGTAGQSDCASV